MCVFTHIHICTYIYKFMQVSHSDSEEDGEGESEQGGEEEGDTEGGVEGEDGASSLSPYSSAFSGSALAPSNRVPSTDFQSTLYSGILKSTLYSGVT